MVQIKTPEKYINEENIIQSAGKYISAISPRAIIIGGKTALETVGERFFQSLLDSGVLFNTEQFSGYATKEAIDYLTEITKGIDIGVVVGVGGGSVLDVAKAVAENSGLPVVTIPTIAATCAAWSALSVIYDEDGKVTDHILLKSSPRVVLVDPKILVEAPIRFLQSGIGDTIVKWYETAPNNKRDEYDVAFQVSLNTAKYSLTVLETHAVQAIQDNKEKRITRAFLEVVDSIIALAGLVGSINSGRFRFASSHAIHDSITSLPETHGSLHGEKVIFGLIAQFILEGKSELEIIQLISTLNELNLPVTLNQIGVEKKHSEIKVKEIAAGVKLNPKALDNYSFEVDHVLVEQAIKKADVLGELSLKVLTK
jgi:glycerol dehydrogenase-like iron-containing ADH family enzyme